MVLAHPRGRDIAFFKATLEMLEKTLGYDFSKGFFWTLFMFQPSDFQ